MWIPAVDRVFYQRTAKNQPLAEAESQWISGFLVEDRPPALAVAAGAGGTRRDDAHGVGKGDLQFGRGPGWITTAGGSWRAAEKGFGLNKRLSSKAGVRVLCRGRGSAKKRPYVLGQSL